MSLTSQTSSKCIVIVCQPTINILRPIIKGHNGEIVMRMRASVHQLLPSFTRADKISTFSESIYGEGDPVPHPFIEATINGTPQTFTEFMLHGKDGRPLPEECVPSDYHKKECEQARQQLEILAHFSNEDWERRAASLYESALKAQEDERRGVAKKRARIQARIAEVKAWQSPSPDHAEHRSNLLRLLIDALDDQTCVLPEPARFTGQELKQQEFASLNRRIEYHSTEYNREVDEAARQTAWFVTLRESLPQPQTTDTENA